MKRERPILEVLAAATHELYGLDLVSAGVVRRGGLYVVLGRMEEQGLIEGREDGVGDFPRRVYRITDAGRAALLPIAKVHPSR
jgi:DNA-binding PadR family transcriptional regulator